MIKRVLRGVNLLINKLFQIKQSFSLKNLIGFQFLFNGQSLGPFQILFCTMVLIEKVRNLSQYWNF